MLKVAGMVGSAGIGSLSWAMPALLQHAIDRTTNTQHICQQLS